MSIFILKILKTNHVADVEPYSHVSIPSRLIIGKGVKVRLGFSIFVVEIMKSRYQESLCWLVHINLTLCGLNFTLCKIIYFTSHGENFQTLVKKLTSNK